MVFAAVSVVALIRAHSNETCKANVRCAACFGRAVEAIESLQKRK